MFKKKPVLAVYKRNSDVSLGESFYLNIVSSDDGKYHSFRCPSKGCGKPVKIGFPVCPFCGTKLKWKYPFETINVD